MTDRSKFIKGLRDAADFWEQHPDVPVPQYGHDISVHTQGDDDVAAFRYVEDCAAAMGVVAGPPRAGSAHYAARLSFGPVVLEVIAVPKSCMDDYRERNRLGDAAMAARKAREEIERRNAELAERLPYGTAVTYRGDPWKVTWTGVADNGEDRCEIERAGTLTGPRETVRVDEVAADDVLLMGGAR